ncbi:MAG: hypothetical protein KBH93_13630 [Anaerolineae bacterium]|nr:hypothetical protein [Anaerolineae bacterium]
MFRQSKRGTLVWLVIVGAALGLVLLAGDIPIGVEAALLLAYLGLLVAVTRGADLGGALSRVLRRGHARQEPSEVAREAAAWARSLPNHDTLYRLLDIGLIVDEQRPDGLALRRGRFVSLDDDGLRPFAIIDVPDALGSGLALVRFELRDGAGQTHYVHEAERWLQPGENILVPDYRFPIRKRAPDLESGGWTAQVSIDGGALGIYHFNLSESLMDLRQQMGPDGELLRDRVWRSDDDDESLPLSLEELLRAQSRQQRAQ